MEDDYHHRILHKATEHENLIIILKILTSNFTIEHIHYRQNEKTIYEKLFIKIKLNVDADTIVTANTSIPINTYVTSILFTEYANK